MVAPAAARVVTASKARARGEGASPGASDRMRRSPSWKLKAQQVGAPRVCTAFWRFQDQARLFYMSTRTEICVAGLIVGNFLMNVIEATIDPQKTTYSAEFEFLELLFNIAFTIELVVNMYAFWFREFWISGWNVFDFVVVLIGLLTSFEVPLPGPFTLLRLMRAFRVFRLFKRVPSLRKIISSLTRAVPGMLNALLIMVITMAIYAILAQEFFSSFGAGDNFLDEYGNPIEFVTSRGQVYGEEYFGNFPKAMFTMFQVLTGDSWCEGVVRPLLLTPNTFLNAGTALFFVSFVVICAIVLINVVVAVMLEKMVDDTPAKMGTESSEMMADDAPDLDKEDTAVDINALAKNVDTIRGDLETVKEQIAQLLQFVQISVNAPCSTSAPSVERVVEDSPVPCSTSAPSVEREIEDSPRAI